MASEHAAAGVAEHLRESRAGPAVAVEIVEGALLAVVAVLTAWSAYQSALWDSRSAASYSESATLRFSAQAADTQAGQQMLYDATAFNAWLAARDDGNDALASFLERRFRAEYRPAFEAWLATDPFHNPSAPPGPGVMPEYRNASAEHGKALEAEATTGLNAGHRSREVADDYVRAMVFLAVVLFLTALSQRFRFPRVRLGIICLAFGVLAFSVYVLATVDTAVSASAV